MGKASLKLGVFRLTALYADIFDDYENSHVWLRQTRIASTMTIPEERFLWGSTLILETALAFVTEEFKSEEGETLKADDTIFDFGFMLSWDF
jgi:hypothetical protein